MHLRTNALSPGRAVDYEALKANAFHDQQMVIANIDDPRLDSFERQYLRNIGNKLFGKRDSKAA